VNGNVHYGVIEMAPGAVITGKLVPLNHTSGTDTAPAVEAEAEAAKSAG
jgi:cytoskeletal protein CcmA (bactofilin family)